MLAFLQDPRALVAVLLGPSIRATHHLMPAAYVFSCKLDATSAAVAIQSVWPSIEKGQRKSTFRFALGGRTIIANKSSGQKDNSLASYFQLAFYSKP